MSFSSMTHTEQGFWVLVIETLFKAEAQVWFVGGILALIPKINPDNGQLHNTTATIANRAKNNTSLSPWIMLVMLQSNGQRTVKHQNATRF